LALPAELGQEKTERLRAPGPDAVEEAEPAEEAAAAEAAPSPGPRRHVVRRLGRRVAHAVLGREVTAKLRDQIVAPREHASEALRRSDELLHRVSALEQQLSSLQRPSLDVELVRVDVHAATVNLELLKGEVRSVVQALEDLGMAIAPATGLAGAGVRLSELRERVNGLDRRLRSLVSSAPATPPDLKGPTGGSAARPAPEPPAGQAEGGASRGVDYVGFERRFRGDPEMIAAELSKRYLDLLAANPPVLDIGCGNAGLLELLTKRGVEAIGVDTDPSMVAEARDRGLQVELIDGSSFLRAREPGSIGAIIATHVVEHLELGDLVELLELAATRLRPGGVFIAETPNPTSLIVLGNSYILDPTHLRPLHPSLLAFLCEGAGFRDVRLHFYSPASDYQLPLVEDPDAPAWTKQVNEAFTRLNSVLFGPQEYAVIATAAPRSPSEPEQAEDQA
jgi:SAM-dependent methyltransferase